MPKVLVGTYRPENEEWIKKHLLYNLPIGDEKDIDKYKPFEYIVLFAIGHKSLAFGAKFQGVCTRRYLSNRGYSISNHSHADRYALYTLENAISATKILSDPASDVCVCSSRWTGVVDEKFFSSKLPSTGGRSLPNIFEELRPYFRKWHSCVAANPVQLDFFSILGLVEDNGVVPFPGPIDTRFTFIDLFAGIGGFHLAMERLGGKCVFASEWDKDAMETYHRNFGIDVAGDITRIREEDIPPHDVLCAGFPCQPFSKAGQQKGFEDETKGTLFFDVERILKYHRSRYIVLENVRNLVTHDDGNTWKTIYTHLKKLGYRLTPEPLIVSPHQFGIPQLRERVVILGIYDPEHSNQDLHVNLPAPMDKESCSLDRILEEHVNDKSYALTQEEIEEIDLWDEFYHGVQEKVIGFPIWSDYFKIPPSPDMPNWKRNFILKNNQLYQNNKEFIDGWLARHNNLKHLTPTMRKMEWQCGTSIKSLWEGVMQKRPSGLRIKRPDCAPALVAIVQVPIIGKYRRRMTVREAARLQSFPDEFLPCDNRHQAYKQFGNAVNVEVIYQCARRLFDYE